MSIGKITGLTNKATQQQQIVTLDGYTFNFFLQYQESQLAWFWSIEYQNIKRYNQLVNSMVNITVMLKNILPFGIFCKATDISNLLDPYLIDDFSNNRFELLVGNKQDIQEIEASIMQTLDNLKPRWN